MVQAHSERLSVEQLAERVGMSVRTIRFYAGRGLIPPPVREGRNGFYGADHLARLELVRELQAHGFTLSAIEGYLERLPEAASPGDVALQRTMLAPWLSDLPETAERATLEARAGRPLSDDDIELLVALRVVEPTPDEDVFRVSPAHLSIGIELMDLGLPLDGAVEAERIFETHARAIAEELTEVFRVKVLPHYRASGESSEAIAAMVERFKPLTVQALVTAYESAVNETKREIVRRRT
ncbi:MerR family transcriptional regulator [Mumia sp. DW29H23]|uniref:MerR family transcriptional regulator n=1 Tax=Mumia sp. DW29H23 TaxID=3421241 RepID=UPI003D69412E